MKLFSAQKRRENAAIFGVDKSNVQLWRKHKAAISEYEMS
jgi:hypothetical protein